MDGEDGRRSGNVEDRRGMRIPGGLAGGGGIGVVVIALVVMFFRVDPRLILPGAGQVGGGVQQPAAPPNPAQDQLEDFVPVVLADTEDTWGELFAKSGSHYEQPKLVLFTGAVQSACGTAPSAVGPFYCPGDRRVYIDLDFYHLLADRFGAPGDSAQAYVIADAVGHHVKNLLGISRKVQAASQRSPGRANQLSVRQQLQADCLAGIWGHFANRSRRVLQAGDIDQGLAAAAAIGDDRLQQQAQGQVSPETFTHGSSKQRVHWFKRGLDSGDVGACDTFKAQRP